MPTDNERREVARRLRKFASDYGSDGVRAMNRADANDRLFKAIGFDYLDRANWVFLGDELPDLTPAYAKRLADLIEPDTTTDTTKSATDTTKCDRDALLELADGIEYRAKMDIEKRGPYYGAKEWLATAACIRDALGESDG